MLIDPISNSNPHASSNSNYSKMINHQLAIKINGATLQPPSHPPPPLPTSQIPNNQQFMHSGSSSVSNSSHVSSSSGPVSSASSSSSTTPSSSVCNNNLNENDLEKSSTKLTNPKFITINHSNFPYSRSNQSINESGQAGKVLTINNYSKEFQSKQSTNYQNYSMNSSKTQHKPHNLVKPTPKQPCSSVSMKNINEIANQTGPAITKNDYNLQLALKAATAALQKSKIAASSTMFTNNPLMAANTSPDSAVSQSQMNLASKFKENSSQKYAKQLDTSKLLITPSVSTNSLNINSSQTVNSQASQSLFQPYSKTKQKIAHKLQVSGASSSFAPVSKPNKHDLSIIGVDSGLGSELGSTINLTDNKPRMNCSSNSSNNSIVKLYRTSLVVDNGKSLTKNPNESSVKAKKADTSDYDNLEEDNINISVNLQPQIVKNNSLLDEANLNSSFTSLSSTKQKYNSQLALVTSDYENDSMNNSMGAKTAVNSNVNSILKAAISNLNVNSFNYSTNVNKSANSESKTLNFKLNKAANTKTHHAGILKRQKSASTEFLNVNSSKTSFSNTSLFQKVNPTSKDYENMEEDEDVELTLCNQKAAKAKAGSPQPPQIQPFSGVLSKSLFSLVLKPQPVKPVVETAKKNLNSIKSPIPITLVKQNQPKQEANAEANFINPITESQSSIQTTNTSASLSSSSANGIKQMTNVKMLKKKCVSTTNLKYDSLTCSSFLSFNENKSPISNKNGDLGTSSNVTSSKSVSFLSKIDRNDDSNYINVNYDEEDSSDNSINIDDASHHHQINTNEIGNSGEIEVLDNEDMEKNKKLLQLEEIVRLKTSEVEDLKAKLKLEMDKHKMCRKQRNFDLEELEEEKQIYEQKLNSIRTHFNQQLKLFEQNERSQMQEKINSLQEMYNELKANYKKSLEAELKHLRIKLNESQTYAAQLVKQLQASKVIKPRTNTLGIQTNDLSLKLENNLSQNELIFYIKKLKSENNELKFQLDSERRFFQSERKAYSNKNDYAHANEVGVKVPLQIQQVKINNYGLASNGKKQSQSSQQQQPQQSAQQQLQKSVLVNQQNFI